MLAAGDYISIPCTEWDNWKDVQFDKDAVVKCMLVKSVEYKNGAGFVVWCDPPGDEPCFLYDMLTTQILANATVLDGKPDSFRAIPPEELATFQETDSVQPPPKKRRKTAAASKKAPKLSYKWRNTTPSLGRAFREASGRPSNELFTSDTPASDIFTALWPDDLTQLIADATNHYAVHEGKETKWVDITLAEMKSFIGLFVATTVIRRRDRREHWGSSPTPCLTRPEGTFGAVMPRARFEAIWRNIRVQQVDKDETDKPMRYVQPIIDALNVTFPANFTGGSTFCVDEGAGRRG